MENVLDLQERLDHSLRMQDIAEDNISKLKIELHEALDEIARLRSFMKVEGERLIQAC